MKRWICLLIAISVMAWQVSIPVNAETLSDELTLGVSDTSGGNEESTPGQDGTNVTPGASGEKESSDDPTPADTDGEIGNSNENQEGKDEKDASDDFNEDNEPNDNGQSGEESSSENDDGNANNEENDPSSEQKDVTESGEKSEGNNDDDSNDPDDQSQDGEPSDENVTEDQEEKDDSSDEDEPSEDPKESKEDEQTSDDDLSSGDSETDGETDKTEDEPTDDTEEPGDDSTVTDDTEESGDDVTVTDGPAVEPDEEENQPDGEEEEAELEADGLVATADGLDDNLVPGDAPDATAYVVRIPSNIDLDSSTLTGTMVITASGICEGQTITIHISSENGFKLVAEKGQLNYEVKTADNTLLTNGAKVKDFTEDGSCTLTLKVTDIPYRKGVYTDSLSFTVTSTVETMAAAEAGE